MNPLKAIFYQLHLLQLENYELKRFWPLLWKKGYFYSQRPLRQNLVVTSKIGAIAGLSVLFMSALLFFIWMVGHSAITTLGALILIWILQPLFLSVSLILLKPADYLMKYYFIGRARNLLQKQKNLTIIGIAGSYGKTTFKNILAAVLTYGPKVQVTPESVNTTVGIAQWLLRCYDKETRVLIIEMGEHYRGDIKDICFLTPPKIAVVTGINEAHFERLGSLQQAAATIFEISQNAAENPWILMNADDKRVRENYKSYTQNQSIAFYSSTNHPLSPNGSDNVFFDQDKLCWYFKTDKWGEISVPLLGHYAIGQTIGAMQIAERLNIKPEQIRQGLLQLQPVPHRLQPILSAQDVLVIDDSYNGNPDGFNEALNVLKTFSSRRKIILTPGLVETGPQNQKIHQHLGQIMASVVDLAILVENSATPFIAQGLTANGFPDSNIIWFKTAPLAHQALPNILQPHDVILFQNDWGDQYL